MQELAPVGPNRHFDTFKNVIFVICYSIVLYIRQRLDLGSRLLDTAVSHGGSDDNQVVGSDAVRLVFSG